MTPSNARPSLRTKRASAPHAAVATVVALLAASSLAACGSTKADAASSTSVSTTAPVVVKVGQNAGKTATPVDITVTPDPAIR